MTNVFEWIDGDDCEMHHFMTLKRPRRANSTTISQPYCIHLTPFRSLVRCRFDLYYTHTIRLWSHIDFARAVFESCSLFHGFAWFNEFNRFFFSLHFLHFFFSRFRLKMSKIIINLFVINERQLINHFGSLFRFSSVFSGRALRSLSGVFTVSQYRPAKSKWNIYKYFIACECGDSATGLLLVLRSSTDSFAHAHMLWQPPECWFDCRNTHYPMIII